MGLIQAQLFGLTGIKQWKISILELEKRQPDADERRVLRKVLENETA